MEKITGKADDLVLYLMHADKTTLWDLSKHQEKRSLPQNAYFHRLVGLLAKGEQTSAIKKKNELILHYGVQEFERDKDGNLIIEYLRDDDAYKYDEKKHYFPTEYGGEIRGVIVRAFLLLIGTHKYTAAEMVHLIECTRNECLGADIPITEIETFEEKKLMEELRRLANAQANKSNGNNPKSTAGS